MTISRREFLGAGAAAAAGLKLRLPLSPTAAKPVVISSANGIRGVAKAYDLITKENADTLDAVIAGVNIQ